MARKIIEINNAGFPDIIGEIHCAIIEDGCFELGQGEGAERMTISIEVKSASFQELRMTREVIGVPVKAK